MNKNFKTRKIKNNVYVNLSSYTICDNKRSSTSNFNKKENKRNGKNL